MKGGNLPAAEMDVQAAIPLPTIKSGKWYEQPAGLDSFQPVPVNMLEQRLLPLYFHHGNLVVAETLVVVERHFKLECNCLELAVEERVATDPEDGRSLMGSQFEMLCIRLYYTASDQRNASGNRDAFHNRGLVTNLEQDLRTLGYQNHFDLREGSAWCHERRSQAVRKSQSAGHILVTRLGKSRQ